MKTVSVVRKTPDVILHAFAEANIHCHRSSHERPVFISHHKTTLPSVMAGGGGAGGARGYVIQ